MNKLAVVDCLIFLAAELHRIAVAWIEGVDLLVPQAENVLQLACGEAAKIAEIVSVYHCADVGGDERTALGNKSLDFINKLVGNRVEHGCDDQLVLREVGFVSHDIGIDAAVKELLVVTDDGLVLLFVSSVEALCLVQCPEVLRRIEYGNLTVDGAANNGVQLFKSLSEGRYLAEYAVVFASLVADNGAVEFFNVSSCHSPLEVLYAVGSQCHSLKTAEAVNAGTLQLVDIVPVGHAGCAFHKQERLAALDGTEEIVIKANVRMLDARIVAVPEGVCIPGCYVHVLCHFPIVDTSESAHEICGDGLIRELADSLDLKLHVVDVRVGGKLLPIERETVNTVLSDLGGSLDEIPVCYGVAPESRAPAVIEIVESLVFRLQIFTELCLTGVAVADGTAVAVLV